MKKAKQKINCIYRIYSKIHPEREYYGSALDFNSRKYQHFYELKRQRHCNTFLQNHYNKHGESDLVMEIVEIIPILDAYSVEDHKKNLLLREQHYLDTNECFFNICKVAGSKMGVPTSEETKKKMSLKNKGQKRSDGFRKLMSLINIGNTNGLGYKHSAGTKQKLSQMQIGKTLSEEHKRNIGISGKGRVVAEETRQKISNGLKHKPKSDSARQNMSNSAKNRKPITEETRQKLSIISKGRPRTSEWIQKISESNETKIGQYDAEHNLLQEWKSVKIAAQSAGIARTGISNVLIGRAKTAGGFFWKYIE